MQVCAGLETSNHTVSARVIWGSSAVLCTMHQV